MALTTNSLDLRGKVAAPLVEELMHENDTVGKGLVTFQDNIKSSTMFPEYSATVTMQAFTSGIPASAGNFDTFDTPISPVRALYHHEFDPTSLNLTSWRDSIKAGAWEYLPTDFDKRVIGGVYAKKISLDAEAKFWNHATAAHKAAVAALVAGAANNAVSAEEKALVAATNTVTGVLFNGVIQYAIFNSSNSSQAANVGGRIKVVGTTITDANIRAEYLKVHAAFPTETLQDISDLRLYVPRSHKQLIASFNSIPTNFSTGGFRQSGNDWYFMDIKIEFVPIPEKVIFGSKKSFINWCTDLQSDLNEMLVDKTDPRAKTMFVQSIFTIFAHITNQRFNVLYVG